MPIARLSPPTTGRVPPRYLAPPGTRLAWWALGLDAPAVALLVLVRGERSLLLLVLLLLGAFWAVFLVGEVVSGE